MTFKNVQAANFSSINRYHYKCTKIHIKQNSAHNTKKSITPANQPALRPHKQIEYEKSPKRYPIPGLQQPFIFQVCMYELKYSDLFEKGVSNSVNKYLAY